jgi:hypothetical protein
VASSEEYIGWGSGPWSRASWGVNELAVFVDSNEAIGDVGSVNVTADAIVVLTGLEAVASLGEEAIRIDVDVAGYRA